MSTRHTLEKERERQRRAAAKRAKRQERREEKRAQKEMESSMGVTLNDARCTPLVLQKIKLDTTN